MNDSKQWARRFLCAAILCLVSAFAHAVDAEDVFWESVLKGNVQEEYELYLKQYPHGRHAQEAQRILGLMREKAGANEAEGKRRQEQAEAAKKAREEARRQAQEERQRAEAEAEQQRAEREAGRKRVETEAMRPGRVFRECEDCPEMVVITGGTFSMGSPPSEVGRDGDEGPVHRVTLPSFALGRTEVTVGQFRSFVQASGYKTEAERNIGNSGCFAWNASDGKWAWREGRYWDSPGFTQSEAHPVACVSWNDAKAYLAWLSDKTRQRYGLPSEAQWEYAARGGTAKVSRYWGDNPDDACRYANVADKTVGPNGQTWTQKHDCDDGYWFSAPVAHYSPNNFGLYDMLGNVWEWTEDCGNGNYNGAPTDGSAWTSGICGARVLRGGSWSLNPRNVRAAGRGWDGTTYRVNNSGFRPARMLP